MVSRLGTEPTLRMRVCGVGWYCLEGGEAGQKTGGELNDANTL